MQLTSFPQNIYYITKLMRLTKGRRGAPFGELDVETRNKTRVFSDHMSGRNKNRPQDHVLGLRQPISVEPYAK